MLQQQLQPNCFIIFAQIFLKGFGKRFPGNKLSFNQKSDSKIKEKKK